MQSFEYKRKNLSIVFILIAVVIIVVIAINAFKNNNTGNNVLDNEKQNTTNYTTTVEGNKVNTSEEVSQDKKVGEILLEKSKIVYENGTSKLTSKVTNDSVSKDKLRFKVKFITNDGSVIAESVGFVGEIKANETKYIDSYITSDVSNVKNIVYEIME